MNQREENLSHFLLNEMLAEEIIEMIKGIPVFRDMGRTYLIEVTAIELSDM